MFIVEIANINQFFRHLVVMVTWVLACNSTSVLYVMVMVTLVQKFLAILMAALLKVYKSFLLLLQSIISSMQIF